MMIIYGVKNTQLEMEALIKVLDVCSSHDIIHTDCQRVYDLFYKGNYKNEYQRHLLGYMREKEVKIVKVDGHKPSKYKKYIDVNFSIVDRATRRYPRSII